MTQTLRVLAMCAVVDRDERLVRRAIMRRATLVGIAMLAAAAAGPASAYASDRQTTFVFSAPFAVPGVTLPAGQYQFRLIDGPARRVVQVLSVDGRTPYATFFALDAHRSTTARGPEITFFDTVEGAPPAVTAWWHPGSAGYEFVYSGVRARRPTEGEDAATGRKATSKRKKKLEG